MTPEYAMQLAWLVWVISWFAAAAWSDRAAKRPPVAREIVYRVVTAAGAALLFKVYPQRLHADSMLWRIGRRAGWLAVAAAVLGFAFAWWARIHLGRLWSGSVGRKAAHHIVDSGPYALVRHPIYTGLILSAGATAAMYGTALACVGAAMMTFGWYIKAHLEEEFLREQLGAGEYDAYARRVPMLVPFVHG
ncbi:MAG: methyltransferase family protein [Betaproteobacteria bacterium]